jgi:hypothetical protein
VLFNLSAPVKAEPIKDLADLSLRSIDVLALLPDENHSISMVHLEDHSVRGPAEEVYKILKAIAPRDEQANGVESYQLTFANGSSVSAQKPLGVMPKIADLFLSFRATEIGTTITRKEHAVYIYNLEIVETLIPAMKDLGYPVKTMSSERGAVVTGKYLTCSDLTQGMHFTPYCKVSLN